MPETLLRLFLRLLLRQTQRAARILARRGEGSEGSTITKWGAGLPKLELTF